MTLLNILKFSLPLHTLFSSNLAFSIKLMRLSLCIMQKCGAYIVCSVFGVTRSNIACDSKHLLFGLSDGSLYNISWKGEVMFVWWALTVFIKILMQYSTIHAKSVFKLFAD